MDFTITALRDNDLYAAYEVEPLEEVVDQIHTKLKSRHVKRLQTGKCTIELGFIFTDILTALERISDHCSNVAVCMVQVNDDNFETHEYLRTIKTSGAEFDTEVEKFQQQFILPKKEALWPFGRRAARISKKSKR
jgi:phosphate:Na+ symporter